MEPDRVRPSTAALHGIAIVSGLASPWLHVGIAIGLRSAAAEVIVALAGTSAVLLAVTRIASRITVPGGMYSAPARASVVAAAAIVAANYLILWVASLFSGPGDDHLGYGFIFILLGWVIVTYVATLRALLYVRAAARSTGSR